MEYERNEWLDDLERKRNEKRRTKGGGRQSDSSTGTVINDAWLAGALRGAAAELAAMPPNSGRNHALNKAAWKLAHYDGLDQPAVYDALLGACERNGLAAEDGMVQCEKSFQSGWDTGRSDERWQPPQPGSGGGGSYYRIADSWPGEPGEPPMPGLVETEGDFWDRPSLRQIFDASLARMVPPWAVLANCVARALVTVRPHITLPPIIGGPGNLNWFAIIVAGSSGGKSASESLARELVSYEVCERNIGSGEGMIGAFKQTGNPPVEREAVLFSSDEIDILSALHARSGSTTMGVLRSMYSGQTLGFSYITKGRDTHVAGGTYRATVVLSAQPGRCKALLADAEGGTPQRFMWFPGQDARIDLGSDEWLFNLSIPKPGTWMYPRQISIPKVVEDEIRWERRKTMRGEGHDIGHLMYTREKFAFGLALLDNRDYMSEDDWRLSGLAVAVSERTRKGVVQAIVATEESDAEELGRLRGITSGAADDAKAVRMANRDSRIRKGLLAKLAAHGPMSEGYLYRAVAYRDRPFFHSALTHLVELEVIRLNEFGHYEIVGAAE